MPQREWIAEIDGHSVRVSNSWTGGAKLYVDGECRDTNTRMFLTSSSPALSARLDRSNVGSPLIEVFMKAVFTVKAKICVDGKQVAGDVL